MRAAALIGALLLAATAAATARAQDDDRAQTFAAIVDQTITAFIRPGYERFSDLADLQLGAVQALCEVPSEENLAAARDEFQGLAVAWSRISMIRFGPVAEDNRFERLWFFPDRKGLALRQIQALLADQDETALAEGALKGKSVALQGLPALEYALFGQEADALAQPGEAGYRCRLASAVAANIAALAAALTEAWDNDTGYADAMRKPGPDNATYRSGEEVIRALLGAMTAQLEFVRDTELLAALGDSVAKAQPKRAPFWRSGRALAAVRANVWSVLQLYETGGFDDALAPDNGGIGDEVRQAVSNVLEAIGRVKQPFLEAAIERDDRSFLLYATVALRGALAAIGNRYANAIGISMGFNALDGD